MGDDPEVNSRPAIVGRRPGRPKIVICLLSNKSNGYTALREVISKRKDRQIACQIACPGEGDKKKTNLREVISRKGRQNPGPGQRGSAKRKKWKQ